jgi:hypothetical protein
MIGTMFMLSGNGWLIATTLVFTIVAAIGALSVQIGPRT